MTNKKSNSMNGNSHGKRLSDADLRVNPKGNQTHIGLNESWLSSVLDKSEMIQICYLFVDNLEFHGIYKYDIKWIKSRNGKLRSPRITPGKKLKKDENVCYKIRELGRDRRWLSVFQLPNFELIVCLSKEDSNQVKPTASDLLDAYLIVNKINEGEEFALKILSDSESENFNDIPAGNKNPKMRRSSVNVYERDASVSSHVIKEAKGRCEVCTNLAPFKTDNDNYFLEVHHVKKLSEKGPDTVDNVIAVCPNCHREMHYGINRNNIMEKIISKNARLKRY